MSRLSLWICDSSQFRPNHTSTSKIFVSHQQIYDLFYICTILDILTRWFWMAFALSQYGWIVSKFMWWRCFWNCKSIYLVFTYIGLVKLEKNYSFLSFTTEHMFWYSIKASSIVLWFWCSIVMQINRFDVLKLTIASWLELP